MLATPRERGHWSYESRLSYEKHSGGMFRLPDEHLRCTFTPLPSAEHELGLPSKDPKMLRVSVSLT